MELQLVMVSARALILIMNTIIGGGCIYLGWRLYFEAVRADSTVEINSGSMKLIIQSAAPGLFFVGFGIFLLIYVLQQKVELQLHDVGSQRVASQVEYVLPAFYVDDYTYKSNIINVADKVDSKNQVSTAEVSKKCMFNEKYLSFKWADEADPRTNKEKIHEALTFAQSALVEKMDANPEDSKLRRMVLTLKAVDEGFKNEK